MVLRPVEADGTYCFRLRSGFRGKTCTIGPVPSAAAEADAKRFQGEPDLLTFYIVRKRWADAEGRIAVTIDERAIVITIAKSLVRIRTTAREVRLKCEWDGGPKALHIVTGQAGDVRFVQLVGSIWAWGANYRWDDSDDSDARRRALGSKLIADLPVAPLKSGASWTYRSQSTSD
jgi:hypothetical protein